MTDIQALESTESVYEDTDTLGDIVDDLTSNKSIEQDFDNLKSNETTMDEELANATVGDLNDLKLESSDLPDRTPVKEYFQFGDPIAFNPIELPECENLMLAYNLMSINKVFNNKAKSDQKSILSGTENLKSLFNQLKTSLMVNDTSNTVEWDKWLQLINDELSFDEINSLASGGVPDDIRNIIWQVVAKSNNLKMNDYYLINKLKNSIHERQIKKDITRNSFYNSINQYNKINDLYNNLKIYSEVNPEIGYNQSFTFILSPIILKLPELESFNLFYSLLEDYGIKSLFDRDMTGLQIILYKFDRLLEIYCPKLFNHFIKQGIKSNMYASQWFLTMFSYKLPIDIVLKIYDMVIFEGIDYLLKISIKLMSINEQLLLSLKFDKLMEYLRNHIIDLLIEETPNGIKYNAEKLFSNLVNLNPNLLKRFELEVSKQNERNEEKVKEINKINLENGKLRNEIKYLQMSLTTLNKDHLNLVQTLINSKIRLPELVQQNSDLTTEIERLKEDLNDMKHLNEDDVPANIETEIEKLLVENKAATEKNISLEDQLSELISEEKELDDKLKVYKKNWFWNR